MNSANSVSYPELGLPQAWRPIFKAMETHGWQLETKVERNETSEFDLVLRFDYTLAPGQYCHLSFWNEPEWCGNNLQQGGLNVVGISRTLPLDRRSLENHSLLLTGDWEEDLEPLVEALWKNENVPLSE